MNARAMLRHLAVRLAEKAILDDKRFDELSKFVEEIEGRLREKEKTATRTMV